MTSSHGPEPALRQQRPRRSQRVPWQNTTGRESEPPRRSRARPSGRSPSSASHGLADLAPGTAGSVFTEPRPTPSPRVRFGVSRAELRSRGIRRPDLEFQTGSTSGRGRAAGRQEAPVLTSRLALVDTTLTHVHESPASSSQTLLSSSGKHSSESKKRGLKPFIPTSATTTRYV